MAKREPSPAFTAARELAKQVGKMSDSDKAAFVARFPQPVTIEGHALSLGNSIMLLTQFDGATLVGGFRQWLNAGRCVAKGSSALWIFAPSVKKAEGDSDKDEIRFRLVPVFDISQTVEAEAGDTCRHNAPATHDRYEAANA